MNTDNFVSKIIVVHNLISGNIIRAIETTKQRGIYIYIYDLEFN